MPPGITRGELKDLLESALTPLIEKLDRLTECQGKLDEVYFGNGAPGLKVVVDRLNVKEKFRSIIERAVAIAFALGGIAALFNHLYTAV